jgi:hypothetical protein
VAATDKFLVAEAMIIILATTVTKVAGSMGLNYCSNHPKNAFTTKEVKT